MTELKFWRGGEAFCRRYFEECDAVLFQDPSRGLEWAQAATFLAGVMTCEDEGRRKVFLAQGYAIEGGAYRLVGDFARAESAYREARHLMKKDDFPAYEKANVRRRLACLRTAQKRFAEAHALVDQAIAVYRAAGGYQAKQDLAWALTTKGSAFNEEGRYDEALACFAEALRYADPVASPRTYHAAVHNTAASVALGVSKGTVAQAFRHVRLARQRLRNRSRSLPRAKLVWLEGSLLAQIHAEDAEKAYRDARGDLTRFGAAYESCMISLDLGALLLEQERWAELRELAVETVQLAERLKVREEGLAALRLWAEAVQGEAVEAVLKASQAARQAIEGETP